MSSSQCVSGYTLSDNRCFFSSTVSRRKFSILPCSSCLDQKLRIENGRVISVPNKSPFLCQASSGGYRRNPDFSRVNKHGFVDRNGQNEERDDFDHENSHMFSSRTGPTLSLSESPKFQATSSPGPREKEIVELFRKVQAQLRARAVAQTEEKGIKEASQGKEKESETVDSLLKLLKKHSGEQSRKKMSNFSNRGDNSYQLQEDVDRQDHTTNLGNSQNRDHNTSSYTRPTSSFKRKSPVPRTKFPPTYFSETTYDQTSSYSVTWTQKKDTVESLNKPEHEPESEPELEPEADHEHEHEYESEPGPVLEPESKLKPESTLYQEEDEVDDDDDDDDGVTLDVLSDDDESLDTNEDNNEAEEEEATKDEDLSSLKVMELKEIAKSRGLKGFSKMKKAQLLELLSTNSS